MIIINLAKCSIIVENNTPYYTLFHGFLKSLNLLKPWSKDKNIYFLEIVISPQSLTHKARLLNKKKHAL